MEWKTFSNICGLLRKPYFKMFCRIIDSKMFPERGPGAFNNYVDKKRSGDGQ
jgi:hypothetical protein